MKKICVYIIMLSFISILTTACVQKTQKSNMIQSKRKFAQYMEPQGQQDKSVVDLSEGPRLRYEANFGPKNLNFDIKIVDPY